MQPEAGALSDVLVLDLSGTVAGGYCTKLLADLGAEVWKLEPSGGDPVRRLGPFPPGRDGDLECGGLHLYLNTNKRSRVLDVTNLAGQDLLRELVRNVDILV